MAWNWSLLARRSIAVLGLLLFLAVGVLVFSRALPRESAPSFLDDPLIIPRAYTKGIGSHAPLVRLEIEADTVSVHVVEDGEHAVIYVISRDSGYVARGHRRRLEPAERKDASFAFATVEFAGAQQRINEAAKALGQPPRSVEIVRPAGGDWLLWRIYGDRDHVEFRQRGQAVVPAVPSASG